MNQNKYGWFTVNREITEHWIWNCEPYSKGQAWIDLLAHTNHTDKKIMLKGCVVYLKRGQQARSQVTLSKKWKWSRDKVKRFLKVLEDDGMISQQTSQLTSIISVCNYSDYQQKVKPGKSETSQQKNIEQDTGQVTVNNGNNGNNKNSFIKPTAEEVANHFITKEVAPALAMQEGKRFIEYYNEVEWVIGKSKKKMSNWKSSASGWNNRRIDRENNKRSGHSKSNSPAERTAERIKAEFGS
jgi:hypothetical protein